MSANPERQPLGSGLPRRDAEFDKTAMRGLAEGPTAPIVMRHPGGLYLLFVTEMWERFSYYGMRAFLVLYMTAAVTTGGLGWTKKDAGSLYGWYTGLVYLTPILGGYLADRFLGTHWSMMLGGAIIAAGHFSLAFETLPSFYLGLFLIIIGTGFFKPCVSVMVSQLYPAKDTRRDAAFTIFYMGINLGAFLGPIICGGLRVGRKQGEVWGWSWAFAAAGVGMVLGLIAYMIGRPFLLKGIGLSPRAQKATNSATFSDDYECGKCGHNLSGQTVGSACPKCGTSSATVPAIRRPLTLQEKQGIAAIFIMAFFVFFFWLCFEQAGSSMNLFAEERTDRSLAPTLAQSIYDWGTKPGYPAPWWVFTIGGLLLTGAWVAVERSFRSSNRKPGFGILITRLLGLAAGPTLALYGILKATGFLKEAFFPDSFVKDAEYPAEWFQSVNPFCILAFAPIFASLWIRLGRRGKEPSTATKFSLGLILLGLGFLFMVFGGEASDKGGANAVIKVSGWYLLAAYTIHTLGELCLSPVGLSMVNKLAPVRFVSLLMGVYFLANFAANKTAGVLAGYSDPIASKTLDIGSLHLTGQALFYSIFVIVPIGAGIVLLCLVPTMKKLMHGRA